MIYVNWKKYLHQITKFLAYCDARCHRSLFAIVRVTTKWRRQNTDSFPTVDGRSQCQDKKQVYTVKPQRFSTTTSLALSLVNDVNTHRPTFHPSKVPTVEKEEQSCMTLTVLSSHPLFWLSSSWHPLRHVSENQGNMTDTTRSVSLLFRQVGTMAFRYERSSSKKRKPVGKKGDGCVSFPKKLAFLVFDPQRLRTWYWPHSTTNCKR